MYLLYLKRVQGQKIEKEIKIETHSGEVVGTAWFPSKLAGKQHVIQLVPETVEKLEAGSGEAAWWEKEPKVRQLAKPSETLITEQL